MNAENRIELALTNISRHGLGIFPEFTRDDVLPLLEAPVFLIRPFPVLLGVHNTAIPAVIANRF